MPALEQWSVLADVAGHLQVSEDTVLRWIAGRALPAHRVGRVWRFKLSEVDTWVRSGPSRNPTAKKARAVPASGRRT